MHSVSTRFVQQQERLPGLTQIMREQRHIPAECGSRTLLRSVIHARG